MTLTEEIRQLKQERNAVILAHNYQRAEVQDIADFVGDSFELARKARELDRDTVVFCGVHFMAESCKILAPDKKVILAAPEAGCPLADTITADELKRLKARHPGVPVVTYINSSAAVKAESDVCCTSSNALQVVESMDSDTVIMTPDAHLAAFVAKQTEKTIIPWNGYCIVHHRVMVEDILRVKALYDDTFVIAHPECQEEVTDIADVVCSTSRMLVEAARSRATTIIVVTEEGMLHRLRAAAPGKQFVLATPKLVCRNMKKTTLAHVRQALEPDAPGISVDAAVAAGALRALDRMLAIGTGTPAAVR